MTPVPTHMRREIEQIPDAAQRLLERSKTSTGKAADDLARIGPHLITTVARGSSDHAAAYLKYAIELYSGVPVASLGPSVATIYGAPLKLARTACLSISQSGSSPDIVRMTEAVGAGGALTIAITNAARSPLADICAHTIDISARTECSVAATKTFVSSIVAGLMVLARWQGDKDLDGALKRLPDQFAAAIACDWSPLSDHLRDSGSMYILGRGPAMAIANEAALKFKETCQIHAEAYSSAELMHGPVSIVGSDFPVLALAARDASEPSVIEVSERLARQGAQVFATSDRVRGAHPLPFVASGHPLTDPLILIVAFYAFVESLARARGLDPDNPPHLKKVTKTL